SFKTGLAVHDDLEKIYIDQMDFNKADEVAEKFIQNLLKGVPEQNRKSYTYRRLFGTNTSDGAVNIVPSLINTLKIRYFLIGLTEKNSMSYTYRLLFVTNTYDGSVNIVPSLIHP